jgi:hypothetical protein
MELLVVGEAEDLAVDPGVVDLCAQLCVTLRAQRAALRRLVAHEHPKGGEGL